MRIDPEGSCEIKLIDITGANPLVDGDNTLCVLGFSEREFGADLGSRGQNLTYALHRFGTTNVVPFQGAAFYGRGGVGGAEPGQPGRLASNECSRRVVERVAAFVDPEPGQRPPFARRPSGGFRLKAASTFIREESCSAVPGPDCSLDRSKEFRDLVCRVYRAHALWRREQLCPRLRIGIGGMRFAAFQQHRGWRVLHQRIDFHGKGMPARHAGSLRLHARVQARRDFTEPSVPWWWSW
jgi:hypothetical protein